MKQSDLQRKLAPITTQHLTRYHQTGKLEFCTARYGQRQQMGLSIKIVLVVLWAAAFLAVFVSILGSSGPMGAVRPYLPYFLVLVLVVLVATVIAAVTNREVGKITLQHRTVTIELHTRSHRPPALFTYCLDEVAVNNKLHRSSNATHSFFTLRMVEPKKSTTFSVDATGKYFEYLAFIAVVLRIQTHSATSETIS